MARRLLRPSLLLALNCAAALGCAGSQDYTGAYRLATVNNRHLPGDTSAFGVFVLAETLTVSMATSGERPVARVVTHILRRDEQNNRLLATEEFVARLAESRDCPQKLAVVVEDNVQSIPGLAIDPSANGTHAI